MAIDAVPLLIRSAGVKNYLYHWIEHLRRAAGATSGPDTIATFPALGGFGPLRHNRSITDVWRTGTGLAALALSNHTPLPVLDWLTQGADIFHCSGLTRHPPAIERLCRSGPKSPRAGKVAMVSGPSGAPAARRRCSIQ